MTKLRVLALALALLLVTAACNDDKSDPSFARFGTSKVTLPDGSVKSMLVADTDALRHQGLSGVADLSGYDGMLFDFQTDTDTQFWMKDTKIPLDLAFIASDGTVVQTLTMPICPSNDNCQRYAPSAPYHFALEAPAGAFADWKLPPGAHLQIG